MMHPSSYLHLGLLSLLAAPAAAAPIEFGTNLPKFSCSSSGAISTPGVPVALPSISTANGPKTILLEPLVAPTSNSTTNSTNDAPLSTMCILSRWSLGDVEQQNGQGHYHPLGRSIPSIQNGEWTKPPGKPGRELAYECGEASNSGSEFNQGDYLCKVTLPVTEKVFVDFSTEKIFAPYYITYYKRSISVQAEISRFLQKASFGPTLDDINSLSSTHASFMSEGMSYTKAMSVLQSKWIQSQMDPSSFSTKSFSSLRKYWRQRVNARAFEVYRIGEAGPAPCEKNSRWRKFAFTKYDVQNARYLRWGEEGVTTQSQQPHKVTVETIDLRPVTSSPIQTTPTSSPMALPTSSPFLSPSLSPSLSSAPTSINLLGYGDFELDTNFSNETSTSDAVLAAWPSSCNVNLLSTSNGDDPADIHSGLSSLNVLGGRCSVLRMMGSECPSSRMGLQFQAGDVIKISLWVKMSQSAQVFQIFTAHYHPRKSSRWAKPADDSHAIARVLVDNAGKWKYVEAYHVIGPDWTFEGEVLEPKLCNHYQLRFNLAESESSYILDDVKVELVGRNSGTNGTSAMTTDVGSAYDLGVGFLNNADFGLGHHGWKMASSSGTNIYDDKLDRQVMQLKKGQVLRQEIADTAVPGQHYSFGMWVRLVNSARPVTLKVIIRMRFTNNDRMYGPCKNPICNLYERPVTATITPGEGWQHVVAQDFDMYGNYTEWDGNVDFILFQVTTNGLANAASLRIASFHDLNLVSVPPSMSLVPSFAPTTLDVEDVAFIVRYAGSIRTVVKRPFQIDETGEVLPMDGSVEYVLCEVEEIEGASSENWKGLGFVVDEKCARIRGGNPTVDLDPRYLNYTDLHILDLSDPNVTTLEVINANQTHGGDLLLQTEVQDDICDTFPSPYDNDYRGADTENPDAVPSRFDPDAPVFAILPDGSYALYDPRIILRENSLENPLLDGGGTAVLRSTLRAKDGFKATQRKGTNTWNVANDENIVLCANEHPNFLNRDSCVLSYDENACVVEKPNYVNEMQRHTFINVQATLTFDNATLAALHTATASSYQEANATANLTFVDNKRYVYAVSNLRYDETNTNGSYPLPCLTGSPRSRWIPRDDLDASTCTNSLQASSTAALASALETSNDQNILLRDIYLWNSVAEDGCDPADELEYGMLVMTSEGCWENVHPDHMTIFDFTSYVAEHPASTSPDTSITMWSDSGILEYPANHPMSYFETLKSNSLLVTPIARYGDLMIVDEFITFVGLNSDPVAIAAVANLGELKLNNVVNKNRGGGVLVCGSPNEVVPDPSLDDFFDAVHADLDCVGCQKSYGDYFAQKQTVWTMNALESEDQFCGRMAWALYELVNVGTTTAPDNTESNLYTYDIFKRHCFGNYYDILKEMSYNPKMGEQFGFVMSTSTRWRYDKGGDLVYPDENYAREIMQLYTIGLHYLNDDGTEVVDQFGRVVQTYSNNDILSNSRIWSGFEYTARRGNVEELFRANKSRQDPMRIEADKHDFFPKLTLGGWIGDRWPLCKDLPRYHFLKVGAQYHLRGGSSVPSSQNLPDAWDADESVKRFVLSPTSSLYQKLCNADANGDCQYKNTVHIDENIPCDGKECRVDTLVIVQVAPGVFYEYIRQPCVHLTFHEDAKKVVTGLKGTNNFGRQYSHAMCADPNTLSAARSCCDAEGNKVASYNYKFEYHGERVSASTNEAQCAADGLLVCDPTQVVAEAPVVMNRGPYNFPYPTQNTFYWTDSACSQFLRVRSDGMVALIHEPASNALVADEKVVPFVSLDSSVTYITMPWLQDMYTFEYLFPSNEDNSCDNGACSVLGDGSCLCPVTVSESVAFDSLPNRTEVLSNLYIGGFDPSMYSDSSAPYSLVDSSADVEAYSNGAIGDSSTIFKVTDEYGEVLFLRNLINSVTIGDSYTVRNPVNFINLAKIDELDAGYEVDAFIKYLLRHQNTPAFVSRKLIQYFGVSNPTPGYSLRVTQAFKQGSYSKDGITFGDGTYGNLAAVAAAIILDPEAMNIVVDDDPISGNVREPLLKVIQSLRSLSFTRRPEVKLSEGLLKDIPWKIGQMVFQPPDQFSFFSSDYAPPGLFSNLDLVAPEAQLLSMSSIVGITNGFFSLFNFGLSNADGGFGPFMSTKRDIGDYSSSVGYIAYQANGTDIANKIEELDTLMTGGRLGDDNKQVLASAYDYFLGAHGIETANRVLLGLMAASPEFQTSNTLKRTGEARTVTPPASKSSEPYKAIVYIYLGGGLDSFNLLTPGSQGCTSLYNSYFQARGGKEGVGLTADDMLTIDGSSAGINGCSTFGVNKLMSAYKQIFDEGKGIFLANMGHLHKPVSKSNWQTETRTDLFSHHSMKREAQYVDAFREGAGPGVLGRMIDVLERYGHAVSATSVNVQAPMVDGDPSTGRYPDAMSTEGLPKIFERQFLNGRTGQELRLFLEELNGATTDNSGAMSNFWSQRFIDVWDKTDSLINTMRGVQLQTAFTHSGPDIDAINQQLKLVAQLIAARDSRGNGVNRDVFFVQMGGFDTHSEMADILNDRLPALNTAVANFWAEIKAQGISNHVTVVQGSEFGRTISANSNGGTDHAWGGNYYMFGGSVAGGKILGQYPTTFDVSAAENIGRGRLIPSRSWDSLWYGISQWFGIAEQADVDYVLPNSQNFGCDLFTDAEMFTGGNNKLNGCGGPSFDTSAELELTEPRLLTGEEQKALCKIALETTSNQLGINVEDARCFVDDQVVTPVTGSRRLENGEQLYMVTGVAKLNFDSTIPAEVASPKKMKEVMKVAKTKAVEKAVKGAIKRTEAPSSSPSMTPSISSAPTTETAAPTRAPVAPQGLIFSSADIGYCKYTGESYETSDGLYNVKASGSDIWTTEDAFHYMFVETSGDVDLSIRVDNFSKDKHEWAKGGLMIRSSLAKDASHYSAFVTGNNGVANQLRRFNGYLSESVNLKNVPNKHKARFVKLTLSGETSINIIEIEVFDSSNVNKALVTEGATATQSSTYLWSEATPCPATIAIDGYKNETEGIVCNGLAHTNSEQNPWLLIDLKKTHDISMVKIYNRISCCSSNLSGAAVSLYDENMVLVRQIDNIGDATNRKDIELRISDFVVVRNPPTDSIWLRVTKVGNVMTSYYKEDWSSFWVPFGKQISITTIKSTGYYVGLAVTAHDNNDPAMMAQLQVSDFNLHRSCSSSSITPEQCEQAQNCELGLRTSTCYDAGNIKAIRVKIQLPTTQYLHLAEVKVFNEYGVNVALNKPAAMSSVYDPDYFPFAEDGNDNIVEYSMFHTDIEQNPWWEVDLEAPQEVHEVHIFNRNLDCLDECQVRANNAIVSLTDVKGRVFDTQDIGVVVVQKDGAPQVPIDLTFYPTLIGGYLSLTKKVKIQLTDTDYLHLTEVQVFDETGVNRALNKPSTMSSMYDSSAADESPGMAVDGITSGSNFFHTDIEFEAWWEVDLVDVVHVRQIIIYNRQDCDTCQSRLSNAVVSLIDSRGVVFDQKNVGDTTGVTQLVLNFESIKKSVLPPKELEAPGVFNFFGNGWCRDSKKNMYDYMRFSIQGVTPQICQDKCISHWEGLVGISTYQSIYCYCWFDNARLPSELPSDIHGYSSRFKGAGEVTLTLNDDGDCYQFIEKVVDTLTPTSMPTESPSLSPTRKPTAKPTSAPTAKPTLQVVVDGTFTYLGNGWCKDHKFDYYDYIRYTTSDASQCPNICVIDRGFVGYSSYINAYCYCWYRNNQTPSLESTSYNYMYEGFGGEGEVTQFQYTGYSTCYKFNPN